MKKTKIICTIGPASDSVEIMGKMAKKGMDCARINLSHATEQGILKTIEVIREVRKVSDVPVAIMYDTKGPEFRTLKFKHGGVSLQKDDIIKMSKSCIVGNENEFGVNHSEAIDFIKVGDKVLIDNALLELEVIEKKDDFVVLKARGDGKIQNNKTINVPGVDLKLDFISEADKKDITFAAKHACDYLALSFVNTREDVIEARKLIEEAGGDALIISKIESRMGIENIDDIINESDGIMVARGDLGVEFPMEELPMLQKSIIKKCRQRGKFAIVATEMLASMYESPRPTRAEVSDVANAILDGTDCVMLSGETTVGKYPIDSVAIMNRICENVESKIDYTKHVAYTGIIGVSDTIAKLVVGAVEYSDIKVIVATSLTGFTARKISNLRPNSTILACCPSNHIAEKVVLNFGVKPVITDIYENTDEMVENCRKVAKEEFNLNEGDLIVVTGGFPIGESRKTNYLRIIEI
ncbi:MAG: pyruvate kinase [Methanosphaera sp.]|uniref:pyruvate kinase n=1 Tax=Methanosphaera sp. TaxID=2666342 RepID=UPI002E78BE16|nr:pyruvate kinase [Methanosphaera sp.]MEE1117321.1 pyruvate kinase [Methanosphaera sp.]MEE3418888.1 pyruvate kinase [Methanosphaera sp.]